jgi:hypothetical protein
MNQTKDPIDLKAELEKLVKRYVKNCNTQLPDYVVDGLVISFLENAVAQVRTKELSAQEIRKGKKNA